MAVVWMSQVDALEESLGDDLGVAELPGGASGKVVPLRGYAFVLPEAVVGERRERALDFLSWWMSPSTQETWQQLTVWMGGSRVITLWIFQG